MAPMGIGAMELVMVLLMGGQSLLGLPFGIPPGERDTLLQQTPPDGCVVYAEWSSRGAGRPDAPGLEGFFADPEILAFAEQAERAARTLLKREMRQPEAQTAIDNGLPLAKTLLNRPGAFFVSFNTDDLPPREDFVNIALVFQRLKAGFILNAGEGADATQMQLTRLCELGSVKLPETLSQFILPVPVPGGGLTLHREGPRFIVCYGQGALKDVLAGLKGERKGLTADERITQALQEVAVDRQARLTWVDLSALVEAADTIAGHASMVEEVVSVLGFGGVSYIAAANGLDEEGRLLTRQHIHTDGRQDGLLTAFTGRPLTPRDLAHIPADADVVVAGSLPMARVLEAVRTIISQADLGSAEQFDRQLELVENELGISLKDDLFAAFGDVWTLSDAPSNGGVLLTAPILSVEVKDSRRAYAVTSQLMQRLHEALPGERTGGPRRWGVLLSEQKFLDRTIWFVNTIGDDAPIAPAFCVTDTHLLAALHPQSLKAHLRFVAGQQPSLADALAKGSPVSDRRLVFYSQADTAVLMRYLTVISPFVGQLMASELQREGVDMDVFSLPSARALLPYAAVSTAWLEVTDHGLTAENHNGFPLSWLSPIMVTMPTASLRAVRIDSAPAAMPAVIPAPQPIQRP